MTNLERIESLKKEVDDKGNIFTVPLTQEMLDEMNSRGSGKYTSGREKQVGDYQLFGFLHETKNGVEKTIMVITLHEEEYGTIYKDAPLMNELRSTIMLELVKI